MYNNQEAAKCLELTVSTVITYIRLGKLVPNDEGLFDDRQIHDFKCAKLRKAVNIIRTNRHRMIEMIKSGCTYRQVGLAFNISLSSIATYFKGQSIHANSDQTYPPRLAKEYHPPANYHVVLEAFSIARRSK